MPSSYNKSFGDRIGFTDDRTAAGADDGQEAGLSLLYGALSQLSRDARNVFTNALTRLLVDLDIVHRLRNRGVVPRAAAIHFVIRAGVYFRVRTP